MINAGDTVAVGLSGGADSMALFHLLYTNRELLGINLLALHVNHGLRQESVQEQQFVSDFCEKLGVKCIVYTADMNSRPKPQGMSTEMWARQLRYEFFAQQAQKYSAKIATAHSLSDKCETVIFNLCRGTGLKGVCGIPAVRGNIIRPLINCTREQIEKYCKENNIAYVTDQSNFSEEYSRNKIRLKVIPELKQINEKAEKQIGEFSAEMRQIYTFLTQLSDNLYNNSITDMGFDINIIKKQDDVVIKFFLRGLLDRYNCLSKENIEDILNGIKNGGFNRQLTAAVGCKIQGEYLVFYDIVQKKSDNISEKVEILPQKITSFLSKQYVLQEFSIQDAEKIKKIEKNYLNNCIDCDTINNSLFLRTRKTGDKFTLAHRGVTKTVKKLFVEDKIPQNIRDNIAILSDDDGNVIWLEGYGTNKPYRVNKNTKKILVVSNI